MTRTAVDYLRSRADADTTRMIAAVNRALFEQGAGIPGPTLWLYAQNDTFYSLVHSRSNFAACTNAGGLGTLGSSGSRPRQRTCHLATRPASRRRLGDW